MKKLLKLFGAITLIFSALFVLTTVAMASDASVLQPAGEIVFNDNLTINGVGKFSSVQIGQEGVGGVTYFNGTVVNVGEYVPLTIGDDMRLDGELWRGTSKGVGDGMPLKISDAIIPTLDNINDLGWPNNRWQNIYYSNMLSGNDININGELSIQSVGSSSSNRISMSNRENTLLDMGSSKLKAQGLKYENYDGNHEVDLGKQVITNFMGSGQDISFHGMQSWNKNNGSLFYSGLVSNHPEYDAIAWNADTDNSGDNTLGIVAGKVIIEGQSVEVKSQAINMDALRIMRFEGVDIRISGGKCQAKLDGVYQDIDPGTLLRGNNGTNTKLRYCETNVWEDLY